MPKHRWKTQKSKNETKNPRSNEILLFTGLFLLLLVLCASSVTATTVTYFNGSSLGEPGQTSAEIVNTSITTTLPTIVADETTQIPTTVATGTLGDQEQNSNLSVSVVTVSPTVPVTPVTIVQTLNLDAVTPVPTLQPQAAADILKGNTQVYSAVLEQQFVDRGVMRMRAITQEQREAAAANAKAKGLGEPQEGGKYGLSPVPGGVPDYFGPYSNYANSQLPVLDSTGNITPGIGIRKFVSRLPGLTSAGANEIGQYIPVAVNDTISYPGSDYYEIALVQFTEKMHPDLPNTTWTRICADMDLQPLEFKRNSTRAPVVLSE